MRNLSAYTFTIIAAIMLLAHNIIPHHHHEDGICIINCTHNCSHGDDCGDSHNKQSDKCFVDHLFTANEAQKHLLVNKIQNPDYHRITLIIPALIQLPDIHTTNLSSKYQYHKHTIPDAKCMFTLVLRGPPAYC